MCASRGGGTAPASRASLIAASRGINAAILLATDHPERVDRIVFLAPYMILEADPEPPDPADLASWREDWRGFIEPSMHAVFTEPGSEDVIAEMIRIGMDASPDVVATQETELDWTVPAQRVGSVANATLVIHGEADAPCPSLWPWRSWRGCRVRAPRSPPAAATDPTSEVRSESTHSSSRSYWVRKRAARPSARLSSARFPLHGTNGHVGGVAWPPVARKANGGQVEGDFGPILAVSPARRDPRQATTPLR